MFVFLQIATDSRRPRPPGTGSNVALKAPLTVESPGYCPHFLELWGSPVLYYSISLVAVSTRHLISPFVHVCITWRESTTNLTPLSSVPLYSLVSRAPPWAPSKPQLGGAGWTLDLCPEVPSSTMHPPTGTVEPLAGGCPLGDQSNGVWRKQRLLYTTFWFDSGTKQDTSLWRSKKSSNSSSLMMNRSASLRASSPEFSPSIRRHWKTWKTSVVFALQGDFHHFLPQTSFSPDPSFIS